jgi:hypothetical protein
VAFWVTAAMIVLFIYASTAPTPLYGVYQARWGFSAATLTAVFAIYILFLLATLLVFGSLSDHVGRRPLIIAAIAVNMSGHGSRTGEPQTTAPPQPPPGPRIVPPCVPVTHHATKQEDHRNDRA